MPYQRLILEPGIRAQPTQTLNRGGWSDGNRIRWMGPLLERIDGWLKLFGEQTIDIIRGIHTWADNDNQKYLLLGQDTAVQIFDGNFLYDMRIPTGTLSLAATSDIAVSSGDPTVTVDLTAHGLATGDLIAFPVPVTLTDGANAGFPIYPGLSYAVTVVNANQFTFEANDTPGFTSSDAAVPKYDTTSGTNIVTVTFNDHAKADGGTWIVFNAVTVGGIVIPAGEYEVNLVDTDSFSIVVPDVATSTATGFETPGGEIQLLTLVATFDPVRQWFIDNFGQVAVFCHDDGRLLEWTPPLLGETEASIGALGSSPLGDEALGAGAVPTGGVDPSTVIPVASTIPNSPEKAAGLLVAMPQAQIIAWGAEDGGFQDRLLLRWCDVGNRTVWQGASTNQAGRRRLSRGSLIVGAKQAPQTTLVWTDIDLWSMQYVGPPFVYNINIIGEKCGLMGPKAHATLGGTTYWVTPTLQFYRYDGGVAPVECPVWDEVFNNMNRNVEATFKMNARSYAAYNEIVFYYVSSESLDGEPDAYVKFNPLTGYWDYGSLSRSASTDSTLFNGALEAGGRDLLRLSGQFFDADGSPLTGAFAESGYIDISDGEQMIFVDRIIPDFKWFGSGGSVAVYIRTQGEPGETPVLHGPFTVTETSQQIVTHLRARQIAFRIEWGEELGYNARLGAMRYRGQPDGSTP